MNELLFSIPLFDKLPKCLQSVYYIISNPGSPVGTYMDSVSNRLLIGTKIRFRIRFRLLNETILLFQIWLILGRNVRKIRYSFASLLTTIGLVFILDELGVHCTVSSYLGNSCFNWFNSRPWFRRTWTQPLGRATQAGQPNSDPVPIGTPIWPKWSLNMANSSLT